MDLKTNINRIHSELSTQFGDVKIEEKSNLKFGNYFELSVTNESKELKMFLSKISLENFNFNWFYAENPLNENAHLVERYSSVEGITRDVKNIFEKNRFSEEYLREVNK